MNSQESGKSPVMIGPVFMHVSKAAETFTQLGKELTCLCPELKNANWIGTDRERDIFKGCRKACLELAIHCAQNMSETTSK